MTDFRARIRASIADGALQAALDGNAERRRKGRLAAFESLPDWRERRKRAHAVRAEVVTHLDEFLSIFIAKVRENGIIVHRARDAAEATQAVLDIAKDSPQRTQRNTKESFVPLGGLRGGRVLVAKSKSMVSEEIGLNHALEAEGLRVVETDLGEYIVQLRGERPSHIITPAVHLRRHEIARLFQEKLNLPYTEDIPALTAAARQVLRKVFLTADVGVSGVNFGVAETGTLCIVTNEGNGRMVTTLPPVHVALMGIERLVPSLDDLALMLSLLPRSATGQKLSVYTQLIHSPRRPGEADGARERHLVLVDNGRSRLQGSPLQEALYCIRCGACLNACPVFREIGGHAYVGGDGSIAPYPGPIGSIVSPGLLGLQQFGHLAQASSLCGACKDACPVDIDLPRLLTRVRAGTPPPSRGMTQREGVGLSVLSKAGLRLYGRIGASPRLFTVSQRLAAGIAGLVSPFSSWLRLPVWTGWGSSRDFPRPDSRPFRKRFRPQPVRSAGSIEADVVQGQGPKGAAIPSNPIEQFIQELSGLGGQAQRITEAELPARLIGLLRERGIETVQMWADIPGLESMALERAGLRVIHTADPAVKVGITAAQAAIAETGSLVICAGTGRPLAASLLPETHIAVIEVSQVFSSLEETFRLSELSRASSVVLITGPSRTADIEMTLTVGVHGPGEIIVFII
jgi:L-lactate dehydrogenase complex protein LldF